MNLLVINLPGVARLVLNRLQRVTGHWSGFTQLTYTYRLLEAPLHLEHGPNAQTALEVMVQACGSFGPTP